MTAWWQRWRARRDVARRLAELGDCDVCRHLWSEHLGTGNDVDGVCGECAYEIEHSQRESAAPACARPCPPLC
ncbi:hypothetical protein V3N99_13845 [Dermatophilaceae bacterium Soc4.6]